MPTVKELQQMLREKGLKVSGKKDELIARLTVAAVTTTVQDKCAGKTCPSGKICNPSSGRCVTATGKIAKSIPKAPPKSPEFILKPKVEPKIKIDKKTLEKLLIMEKVYEKADKKVPDVVKLTSRLRKWRDAVLTPELRKDIEENSHGNKYKAVDMYKRKVSANFPDKNRREFDNLDILVAFFLIFKSNIKARLGREIYDLIADVFAKYSL